MDDQNLRLVSRRRWTKRKMQTSNDLGNDMFNFEGTPWRRNAKIKCIGEAVERPTCSSGSIQAGIMNDVDIGLRYFQRAWLEQKVSAILQCF